MNVLKDISRRNFLELSAQGAAGIGLATIPLLTTSGCSGNITKTVNGSCYHDCPDTCSWKVTTVNNQVTEFTASTDNPYTAGKLCNKMNNFPAEVTFNKNRILTPLKRVGAKGEGKFVPISWEEALTDVSSRLKIIVKEKGAEAILPYSYAGNEGVVQNQAGNRFFAHLCASQLERTICGDAAVAGVQATNGQNTGVLPEDIIHSRFIILWGTNTIYSNQHLWPFIEEARRKGAKLVVVDPFQSETAVQSDWHIQPLPGTDTVLALGLMHVILSENLYDQDYTTKYTSGIDKLTAHVQRYSPETVAELTGLPKETIIDLARAYSKASPSLIRVLIGLEHQKNGASAFRAIAMLPALTGAWRKLGGGLMHLTYELSGQALNWKSLELPEALKEPKTRKVNMVQLGKALTDDEHVPGIQALFVYNSNPAVTTPNQNLVINGLKRADLLTVVLEHFMTDTARYADYIFPATTVLEHWDLCTSWGTPYMNLNEPAIDPVGEAKSNTEFFRQLATKMGFKEAYLYESDLDIIKSLLDSNHVYLNGITFDSLRKSGWAKLNVPQQWMPHAEGKFGGPSGKCTFYNPAIEPPLPDYVPFAYSDDELANYPLRLLSIKSTKHFLNSSHANVDALLVKEGKPFLDISEDDARSRSIADGDQLKAFNQRGEVYLTARIKKKVRQGVVCMPQGFWSSLVKGGSSANALTSDMLTDMGGGAAIQEARVEVMKV